MSQFRRLCALVAVTTVGLTGLTFAGGPAQAAADPRPVAQGAAWLARQLTDGLIHNDQFDFDDYGLSIDTALALDAVHLQPSAVTAVGNAVRSHYYDYVTGAPFGGPNDQLAGAIAKALVLAQVAETTPDRYATAVTADLEARVAETSPIVGRIENQASFDANVIGQSFAARGLTVAGSAKAPEVLQFLLDQQCSDGSFREQFTTDKSSSAQSCAAASGTGSLDATALTVLNLQEISGAPGVASALTDARDYLKSQKNPDGSFGDPANANSTGIAAWALGESSDDARDAAAWLRARQADDADKCTRLAGQVGAVAFDGDALATGRSDGIVTETRDQWRRASSQAVPALLFLQDVPDATLHVTGPSGFVAAGSTASYAISGAHAGSRLCVAVPGSTRGGTATGAGTATLALKLPAGTADRAVTVVDGDGTVASTVSHVLGAKTLTVTPARSTVHRGARLRVVVSGLVPSEEATLRLRGVTVRTGHANAEGRFVRRIRVGHDLGRARIVAWGQFPALRHGRVVIHVVR